LLGYKVVFIQRFWCWAV